MQAALKLLQELIAIPSVSREEQATAEHIQNYLTTHGVETSRIHQNIWAKHPQFKDGRFTLLLNSHHDTVKPAANYTRDPFCAEIADGKLFGLGSNDAGVSVVGLIECFLHYYNKDLPFNLILAISAEEEVMGETGMKTLFPQLPPIDAAIVGEPTQMQAAVAERGLVVLDCVAHGKQGHAARNEGDNALYKAIAAIEWFRNYTFERCSEIMGPIKMTVTQIQAGTQHNVVPGECRFVVDIRPTDAYRNEDMVELIRKELYQKFGDSIQIQPRSTRLQASAIPLNHPLVQAAVAVGRETYISPTTSDIAVMQIPSLKMGAGDSARSHAADEFVYIKEVQEVTQKYIELLDSFIHIMRQKA